MKKITKKINYGYTKKYKDIKEVIEKRYSILIGVIIFTMFGLFMGLFYLQVVMGNYYKNKVTESSRDIIMGSSAPRGRIYDRNHKLIVDNKPNKIIYYKKVNGTDITSEIALANKISKVLEINYEKLSDYNLKNFWIRSNPKLANDKITKKEWEQLATRKLTLDAIEDLKFDRITATELEDVNREAAYIYYLMNNGYSYSEKLIKKDNITDGEYAIISENMKEYPGFGTKLDWNREYLYGDVFKTVLGSVSSSTVGLPYELKDYYLEKGYSLNDRVGMTNLEYQYESTLKGSKNEYQLQSDGSLKLLKEGSRGNDIVLTIDIELQKNIEQIIINNLQRAKNEPNTEFYNRSFVIISDPNTGEILAMAGKQIVKTETGYEIYDYTPGVYTTSVVPGSIVKGASHIVGYNTGALKIGDIREDVCVKIAATPEKCSWKTLGTLNDVTALKYSSNTFQYYTAIKVGGGNYAYNRPLSIDVNAFKIYRQTFKQFGLGIKTGIDLPNENLGYMGTNTLSGLLLDFAIGQYDTYTPIQIAQYINTIANGGSRVQPYLLKEVYAPTDNLLTQLLIKTETKVLNTINTKKEFIDRIRLGFREVMTTNGTGVSYIDRSFNAAGKTGTSESFIDTNNDRVVDQETYSRTFGGYAPYDKPRVAFVVISPDSSHPGGSTTYSTPVNMRITNEVTKKFFEIYK